METSERGQLELEVLDHDGHAIKEKVVVLLNENRAQSRNGFRLESKSGGEIRGEFPTGSYTVQALAKGYHVCREFIEIHEGRKQKVTLRLKQGEARPALSVHERLEKRYGIKPTGSLHSLTVVRGQKIALNHRQYPDSAHVQVLRPKSLSDLKRWVGSPDGAFVGDHPRFGRHQSIEGSGTSMLTSDQQARLHAIAREYIYGNSRAVHANDLKAVENQFMQVATIYVPIFFYQDVVINDGATLEIGNGSSVFVCNMLTIHPLGILSVVGDIRADIGMLQQL